MVISKLGSSGFDTWTIYGVGTVETTPLRIYGTVSDYMYRRRVGLVRFGEIRWNPRRMECPSYF